MMQAPPIPRVHKELADAQGTEHIYHTVGPYFPANHPNTLWFVKQILSNDAVRLVNALKTRKRSNIVFKYMHYQIFDNPSLYDSRFTNGERPMFRKNCCLYLNAIGMAVYFKSEAVAQALGIIRVARMDNLSSYESVSENSILQYATHVYEEKFGDMLAFQTPIIMMRREAYFAIPILLKFSSWNARSPMNITYFRRYYHCSRRFNDWLEYAWCLLEERPHTSVNVLVEKFCSATHPGFYVGEKVFYQPINCRAYNAPWSLPQLDQRAMVVYRSYPRRMLCKLFMSRNPQRVLPAVIPFIRVFQRERFFVSHSKRAMSCEFRMKIQSSLEERFIELSPVCNACNINSRDYVEQNSHKMTLYDSDNIIALLLYFLTIAAQRRLEQLQRSVILLTMDILLDLNLVYAFSKEPAINIAYYLSHLVDGPFVQPVDLQLFLRNLPLLITRCPRPERLFPPYLLVTDSDFDRQQELANKIIKVDVPKLFEKGKVGKAIEEMLKYRMEIDCRANVNTVYACDWKNEYLEQRLKLNLRTMNQAQQTIPADKVSERLTTDDAGFLSCSSASWCAYPKHFFAMAKNYLVNKQAENNKGKRQHKRNLIDLWTQEELLSPKSLAISSKPAMCNKQQQTTN